MVPVTAVTAVNAYIQEMEHLSHGPPPYIPYDHLTQKVTEPHQTLSKKTILLS